MDHYQKTNKNKDKTERPRGIGRGEKTREKIGNGNHMTALRFYMEGEGHQTHPGSLWGVLCRVVFKSTKRLRTGHVNLMCTVFTS